MLELTAPHGWWADQEGRTRVLLVGVNMPGYYSLPVRILSLLVLADGGLRARYDVRYVEIDNQPGDGSLLQALAQWRPRLVGFSVNIWNRPACESLSRQIKQRWPETVVLCGGQEVTQSVVDYLQRVPSFDYLIDGEGEIPFRQFLQAWSPEKGLCDPESVSGLWHRRRGRSSLTRPADWVTSLDEVPSPILAGLVRHTHRNVLGVMLESARGCTFRCSFCFEGAKRCPVRTASVERLAREINYMVAQGAHYFHLMDPILCNGDQPRLHALAEVLARAREKQPRLVVSAEAYAHLVTEDAAKYLSAFHIIDVGLQTVHPPSAKAIHRPWHPDRFQVGIERIRRSGATFNIYLINGLPFETVGSFLQGIRFVLEQRPTRVFFNELLLLNGTELRRRAEEYGYDYDEAPPYRVRANPWMNLREMRLATLVAKTVEHRYNLCYNSLFIHAPWKSRTLPPVENRRERVALRGGCSVRCPGCDLAVPNAPPGRSMLRALLDLRVEEIDLVCGDGIGVDELTKIARALPMTGVNRLRWIGPPSALATADAATQWVESGLFQARTFVVCESNPGSGPTTAALSEGRAGCPQPAGPFVSQTLLARRAGDSAPYLNSTVLGSGAVGAERYQGALERIGSLTRMFQLRGLANIHPHVEVVVLPGHAGPAEYRQCLSQVGACRVRIVEVPEHGPPDDPAWNAAVLDAFEEGLTAGYWVRLPRRLLPRALAGLKDAESVVQSLEFLGLLSGPGAWPPCYEPPGTRLAKGVASPNPHRREE
jgi:radical SAM superfamily enzyme YgiQ (UPF0313 family)